MKKTNTIRIFIVLITALAMAAAVSAKEEDVFFASSDGHSNIRLIWFAPAQSWPKGGWQITDEKGRVWAEKILPMQPETMKGLTRKQTQAIQALVDGASQVKKQDEQNQGLFNGILAIQTMTSFEKAKAMGLATEIKKVPKGKIRFRLCRLDKSNKPYGSCVLSGPVDPQKAAPLPDQPKNFNVVTDEDGARLFWQPAEPKMKVPVMAYVVDRICEDRQFSDQFYLTKGLSWDKHQPAYIDTGAPVEQTVTYNVYSYDLFGRKSLPATMKLFVNDPMSMKPPLHLSAHSKAKKIELSWEHKKNALPGAYVVERAYSRSGFYELLTPDGINGSKTDFTDQTIAENVRYWYRIRAVGSNGAMGEPSMAVTAKSDSSTPPRVPKGLTADVNPVRVKLSWASCEDRIAGYVVEKKAETQKEWHRINPVLVRTPFFRDHFPAGISGNFSYRVTAVGLDGAKGKPSSPVKIVMQSNIAPQVPVIKKIDGKNGRVHLVFDPGKIIDDTVRFSIFRDLQIRNEGKVVKSGMSPKETEFIDEDVEPGRGYWYTVVAKGRQNNKEAWSEKAEVWVGYGAISKAAAPKVTYQEKPFAHVRLRFGKTPADILLAVQRKDRKEGPWMTIQRDLQHPAEFVDAEPVKNGISWYRVVYHTVEGRQGEPSDSVELKR